MSHKISYISRILIKIWIRTKYPTNKDKTVHKMSINRILIKIRIKTKDILIKDKTVSKS